MSAHSPTLRLDGRNADGLREITLNYEGLDRVDGSARFGFGETKALASVSGPIEVRPNLELPSQATLDIHIRPVAAISGTDSKALAATLKAILTPALLLARHPRTLIQVVGQALCGSDTGSGIGSAGRGWNASLTASLVNASSAALLNAGSVPMRGVVCAVSVGRIASGNEKEALLVLDPAEAELPRLSGSGCFAFLFSSVLPITSLNEADIPPCSLLWTNYSATTPFNESELHRARTLAERGAQVVWGKLKESVAWMEASSTGKGTQPKRERAGQQQEQFPESESEVDDNKMEI
ncbi:hypothetical protein IEO21_05281 [Rhodonia placenta]|uniref:Exoribonuclease phosphorolytic domain-containing protein n=2 Tax=Rhodonia placenta TaxID=104341 RepID=A0A1X6MXN8_9APHY|nr:hypothetical protein POSPLADRAFT_1182272 [Postia placenta MAD-698-R-SB12]KAF9814143.1 hypothetical protein IEO21_05281 [Postia placenta]OSX61109.1 hypothetical protein POSPLADRAFT_1182272 [Postia placenta MAD-698-R-SB12]